MLNIPPPPSELALTVRSNGSHKKCGPNFRMLLTAMVFVASAFPAFSLTYTIGNQSTIVFQHGFIYYVRTNNTNASMVLTNIPIGQTTYTLPIDAAHITGVRIYCGSFSGPSYLIQTSVHCVAYAPYSPPCYSGPFSANYQPPNCWSTACGTVPLCLHYQHCYGPSQGNCMDDGGCRVFEKIGACGCVFP